MTKLHYAYRIIPTERIEERLNEARGRGWELHTFCDATEDTWAGAIFCWVGPGTQKSPFADDDEEEN